MKTRVLFPAAVILGLILHPTVTPLTGQTPEFKKVRSAGGSQDDGGRDIAIDRFGNSYVTGIFKSATIIFGTDTLTNMGNFDIFLVKYDVSGDPVWAVSAGGDDVDESTGVTTDTAGNIFVTGSFQSGTLNIGATQLFNPVPGIPDILLVKYDTDGNLLWAHKAEGTGVDYSYDVATDDSGNVFICGLFLSPALNFGAATVSNLHTGDVFLAKYDPDGGLVWVENTGGPGGPNAVGVTIDLSGNIYMTGGFRDSSMIVSGDFLHSAGNQDFYLARYDTDGHALWAKRAGGTNNDRPLGIASDPSGNVITTGVFRSDSITFGDTTFANAGVDDIFVVKYNPDGDVLWARKAGGSGLDQAYNVTTDGSGNVYAAGGFLSATITFGTTTLTSRGDYDVYVVKYDPDGNVLWAKSAGGFKRDVPQGMATDPSGKSFIAGYFESNDLIFGADTLRTNGLWDMFVVEISDVVTDVAVQPGIPSGYTLYQNFPNPFNPVTTIRYALSGREYVKLSIFNMLGQEVEVLVNGLQDAGYKTVSFEAGNLPSGVYTYRITAGTFTAVKKMVLLR